MAQQPKQIPENLPGSASARSALLDDRGVSLPAFQLVGTYTLLAGVYLPSLAVQLRRGKRLSAPAWAYFVISFIDVQANFCMVLAYRFTSVTSVMLLSNWTIPCVMAFSFVALKRRYGRQHLLGAAICVTGLTLLVLSDNRDGGEKLFCEVDASLTQWPLVCPEPTRASGACHLGTLQRATWACHRPSSCRLGICSRG